LEAVALRPGMYFRSLDELHTLMSGHQVAFEQLQLIEGPASFNRCFSDWLSAETGESDGAAGWAYTIKKISEKQEAEANQVLFDLTKRFFDQWTVTPDSETTT